MHFFKHDCLFFRWFGSSEIKLFIYIRHNNLIISYLDIKVTHVSYMKTLLPLTFFSFNSQQYTLSIWLCAHISNFLLILSSNLFAVLLVTAREELGRFSEGSQLSVSIECELISIPPFSEKSVISPEMTALSGRDHRKGWLREKSSPQWAALSHKCY